MAVDLSRLNAAQKAAVQQIEGPVLVLAGAGTGKTTVITIRICYMLENGIAPENILAVTFTNKAAREMKERLHQMVPWLKPDQLTMSTFHSFCCRVLRRYAKRIGYGNNFGIADEGDTKDIIREIITDRHLKTERQNEAYFISGISNAKNDLKMPEDLKTSNRALVQVIGQVYELYQQRLRQMNLIDFDDLLVKTVMLWREHPEILKEYQERYRYIMVDEYQDTNHCQAELLRLLVGDNHNICVVGDDDQSIYGWRGADIDNILDFPNQYANTKIIKLEENYRSTDLILQAANAVIAHNSKRHGKALWSAQKKSEPIKIVTGRNSEDEAKLVGDLIRNYAFDHNLKYDDIAVLYRSNHLSREFELAFRKASIPYRVVGSKAFYERREIKDAVAYLRLIVNPWDDLSFRRIINVPPRGIGAKSMERMEQFAEVSRSSMLAAVRQGELQDQLPDKAKAELRSFLKAYDRAAAEFKKPGALPDKIYEYLDSLGYIDGLKRIYKKHEESLMRRENVIEFISSAIKFQDVSLLDFMEINSLTDNQDKLDDEEEQNKDAVTLLTVHAAKGLEYPLVFIIGLEQKLFPHERSIEDRDIDEERRLFYVAVTRAKQHLVLTRALNRQKFGQAAQRSLTSQFLMELPEELVEKLTPEDLFVPASDDTVANTFDQLREMYGTSE